MILPFNKISKNDAHKAGGKGASLGEMIQAGIPVPDGFVILAEAFEQFIDSNTIRSEIETILEKLNHQSIGSVERASERIQELIKRGKIPRKIQETIAGYVETIDADFVAVRSSATAEDGSEHAWAGQLDTYLNVSKNDIEKKVQSCWASLFTPRALFYRNEKGLQNLHISVAVVVQKMIDAECAGVAFSVHPVTENTDEIVIEGSWGLGEAVVSGEVTPDSFVISKSSGEILSRHIAEKSKGIFRSKNGENEWIEIDHDIQEKTILSDKELQKLSELVTNIENHYGFPCDIEWAFAESEMYILQARPITTLKKGNIQLNKAVMLNSKDFELTFEAQGVSYIYEEGLYKYYHPKKSFSIIQDGRVQEFMHRKSLKNMNTEGLNLTREKIKTLIKNMDTAILACRKKGESILQKRLTFELVQEAFRIAGQVTHAYYFFDPHFFDGIFEKISHDEEAREVVRMVQEYKNIARGDFNLVHFSNDGFIPRLLQRVSSLSGIAFEDLQNYSEEEVARSLNGVKVLPEKILRRKECYIMEKSADGKSIHTEEGEEAKIVSKNFLEKNNELEEKTIRGKVANMAEPIVRGIVRLITRDYGDASRMYEEMDSMVRGEILVTQTTDPEMLPALQKAAAVVTDIGGMLSHTAITARELGISCIVDTKNASKILKDGDMVEVDAERGGVRILEKKKNIFEENWQPGATRNMSLWHDILLGGGLSENLSDYGNLYNFQAVFNVENSTLTTLFLKKEDEKKSFQSINKLCKNGEEVRKLRKKYEQYADEVQESLKKLIKQESEKNLQRFFEDYQRFTAGLWITTGFGRIGTDKLQEALIESGVVEEEIPEIISLMTYPEEHTPLFLSQRDMLEIGAKIQKKKNIDTKKELHKWLEEYKYTPVNFCEDPWDMSDAEDQLRNILEQNCANCLKKLEENHTRKIKQRKSLRNKYNKNTGDISDALAEATSLNEYRKNIFCRLSYHVRFVFEEMMKRIGSTDWRDAYYCTPDEMFLILKGEKIEIERLKNERKKCLFARDGNDIIWGAEKEIQNFFEKIYNKNEKIGNELRGFSANKGKITGTVKVVLSTKDFHKVNRGDILVATMTSVDFVPIMEKAGAFVTNEGGITSHAAIVARELNKPCIIGTKVATKVLKDGDMIEVDAERGIVRILKNSELETNNKGWHLAVTRVFGLLEIWMATEVYHHFPIKENGFPMDTIVLGKKGMIERYLCKDQLNGFGEIARKGDFIKLLKGFQKYEESIKHFFTKDPFENREEFMKIFRILWSHEITGFFLGQHITDKKALDIIMHLRGTKSAQHIATSKFLPKLYRQISKHTHIDARLIKYALPEEIISLELSPKILTTRRDHYVIESIGGNNRLLVGKESLVYAKKFLKNIDNSIDTNISEIKGNPAFLGKVRGKVVVITNEEDLVKVKKGHILVTPMTRTSFLSAMQRCSGYITDEGGITSHAAIMARELKKPCIIGTKIATKILKNGDIVEVDADNGVVKKMS